MSRDSLIGLNDGLALSFLEIADVIEQVWASEPLSALDIIEETAEFYSNPANRAKKDGGGYVYETEDGRKCAAGRCMSIIPGPNFGGINDIKNTIGDGIYSAPFTQEVFKPEYRGHDATFWRNLQKWHDNDANFDDGGISGQGHRLLNRWRYVRSMRRSIPAETNPLFVG